MATLSPPLSPQQVRSDRNERPRAISSMSHASTHSHRSSKSREEKKLELIESARDKRRLEGKSDPTKALQEAQPAAVALEDSNLEDLRSMRHKDTEGNVITDPDRSNPTRPRMERPLDTIRAFNAAAEGTTSRRSSYQRSPSQFSWDAQNKRTSHYGPPQPVGVTNGRPPQPRPGQGGYYNRNSSYHGYRPDAFAEEGGSQYQGPPRQHVRYQSAPVAPYVQNYESPSPTHSHGQSYETMTSGSDEYNKSTNPSSQNSSFDQIHQMGHRKIEGDYPTNAYKQSGPPMRNPYPPTAMPNGFGRAQTNGRQIDDYGIEYTPAAPPSPPKHKFTSTETDGNGGKVSNHFYEPPKRQSWIKRTFSKKGS